MIDTSERSIPQTPETISKLCAEGSHETKAGQAPIARLIICADRPAAVRMYAPGLPPGEHDVYCQPEAVAPMMRDGTNSDPETLTAALERAKPWLVWSPDSPGPQWQLNKVKAEIEKALSGPSRARIRPGVMERLQKLERPSEKANGEPA